MEMSATRLPVTSKQRRSRSRRKPGTLLAVLALGFSLVAMTAVTAGAAARSNVSPKLRAHAGAVVADKTYYKGKTITFYVYGSPGTSVDLSARILAPYMAAYLHCQVNVQNVPGGGTLTGQNLAAAQPPNGLTIGEAGLGGDIGDFAYNTPGLAFNLRAIPYLASSRVIPTVMVTKPTSGITNFKQVVDSKSPISYLAEAGGTNVVQAQLLFGAYKIPPKFIYGYTSGSAIVAGFVRGDGQVSLQGITTYSPLIAGGQAVPILQFSPPLKGEQGYNILKNVPTLEQFAAKYPPKGTQAKLELQYLEDLLLVGTGYFAPVGTPAKYQAALNDAIEFASTRKGAEAQFVFNGLSPGYVTPTAVRSDVFALVKDQTQLATWLHETAPPPGL